jgi:hypothetical protein
LAARLGEAAQVLADALLQLIDLAADRLVAGLELLQQVDQLLLRGLQAGDQLLDLRDDLVVDEVVEADDLVLELGDLLAVHPGESRERPASGRVSSAPCGSSVCSSASRRCRSIRRRWIAVSVATSRAGVRLSTESASIAAPIAASSCSEAASRRARAGRQRRARPRGCRPAELVDGGVVEVGVARLRSMVGTWRVGQHATSQQIDGGVAQGGEAVEVVGVLAGLVADREAHAGRASGLAGRVGRATRPRPGSLSRTSIQ